MALTFPDKDINNIPIMQPILFLVADDDIPQGHALAPGQKYTVFLMWTFKEAPGQISPVADLKELIIDRSFFPENVDFRAKSRDLGNVHIRTAPRPQKSGHGPDSLPHIMTCGQHEPVGALAPDQMADIHNMHIGVNLCKRTGMIPFPEQLDRSQRETQQRLLLMGCLTPQFQADLPPDNQDV